MNDSPEVTPVVKPRGIALITCCKITWDNVSDEAAAQNLSWPRDVIHTFDTWTVDHLPSTVGPVAAYVLVSGAGSVSLSLMLEAPNGEIVLAYYNEATSH